MIKPIPNIAPRSPEIFIALFCCRRYICEDGLDDANITSCETIDDTWDDVPPIVLCDEQDEVGEARSNDTEYERFFYRIYLRDVLKLVH